MQLQIVLVPMSLTYCYPYCGRNVIDGAVVEIYLIMHHFLMQCLSSHHRAGFPDEKDIKELGVSLGPGVKGKVVLDVTNPCTPYPELAVRWDGKSGDSTYYRQDCCLLLFVLIVFPGLSLITLQKQTVNKRRCIFAGG